MRVINSLSPCIGNKFDNAAMFGIRFIAGAEPLVYKVILRVDKPVKSRSQENNIKQITHDNYDEQIETYLIQE